MNDLTGLPALIYDTLKEHWDWKRVDGKLVCESPDCGWEKPKGMAQTIALLKHQQHVLFCAMADAGYGKTNE